MFGHEYYNWIETEDGYVIDWVSDGNKIGWFYSILNNDGKYVASNIFVEYPAPIDLLIPKHLRENSPKARELLNHAHSFQSNRGNTIFKRTTNEKIKPLIFLVDFQDLPSGIPNKRYNKADFHDLFFKENLFCKLL